MSTRTECERAQQSGVRARLQAQVYGHVQGVSFRYHTQRLACELHLTGYVRNQWDDSVEVLAEGHRQALDELLSFLRLGPPSALVTRVDSDWPSATGEFDHFEVRS